MFVLLCCAPDPEPVARLLRRRARETPAGPQPSLINRTVAPHGQDPRTELRAVLSARAGAGITCLSDFMTGQDRESGRLVQVLSRQTQDIRQPIHAVYYRNTAISSRIASFVDYLVKAFETR